ncbi:MAG: hypothetical protein COV45_00950 [Deltaproteobacteria bacterium CG11_big_fil_rev_8_21_14_0_20_47_16]|nr:MAG: hypothetical protein COV45_00950 [Deltaproteobacteria bacterium CG11_big_fil_rev_8_21_14_0_20_47_16]
MKRLQVLIVCVATAIVLPALASDCYICGSGSSDYCKDYCKHSGDDNQANRKKCSDAGCKISGTTSCPTAVNYKVCTVGSLDRSPKEIFAKQ